MAMEQIINKYLMIYWFNDVYAQKPLRTTIMSRVDTNYLLQYKTNSKEGTKAHIGLNQSVYVVLWLKTKFDVVLA